jgi:hypothetical protein
MDMDKFSTYLENHMLETGSMEFFMVKEHIFIPTNKTVKIHRKLRNTLDLIKTD